MSEGTIYILSGAICTGKTTALVKWSANRKDVFGVLTPLINGRRYFMDVHFRNQFEMEADEAEQQVLSVGRFRFSKTGFDRAIQIINGSINKGWLVIDEIGPLELNEQGFYEPVKGVLKNHSSPLLFVIREGLVEKVAEFFDLKEYEVISRENLDQL
jgi:nucleoside-triphosphatase THEP1